jgi:hypothetical protein
LDSLGGARFGRVLSIQADLCPYLLALRQASEVACALVAERPGPGQEAFARSLERPPHLELYLARIVEAVSAQACLFQILCRGRRALVRLCLQETYLVCPEVCLLAAMSRVALLEEPFDPVCLSDWAKRVPRPRREPLDSRQLLAADFPLRAPQRQSA